MLISLFGGVGPTNDQGVAVDVGLPKCEVLLAALALSAGSAVPVGRLVERVWGDRAPRTAEKTLQSYVTRLRQALGEESVLRSGVAYRLDVDPDAVDVFRFRSRLGAGDIKGALAEWTGIPLAGVDAPGLSAVVDGLVEQWLGAVELDFDGVVEADPAVAIGPLTELTASYPFREGLWALLMTALYRVGRQTDALAAYRRARELLAEELGVEPGPRLGDLAVTVLSALLSLERFDDLDQQLTTMTERFRQHGPPTLLQWTLFMSAYSAAMQGGRERADRHFEESIGVDVPAGSLPLNAPMEARSALRRGDSSRAANILRTHLRELVDADVPEVARLACVPFIEIMTAHERFADAAPILRHLEIATGDFGALSARTLIAESADKRSAMFAEWYASVTESDGDSVPDLIDGPAAIMHMVDALDRLAEELPAG